MHRVNRQMTIRSTTFVTLLLVTTLGRAQAQSRSATVGPVDSAMARERANFRFMLTGAVRRNIVDAAAAMPADKFGFAPTTGEFSNVRTFSRQIKHLAATNYILAAAAL